jgi:hypothetical protein
VTAIDLIELLDATRAAGRREGEADAERLRSELRDWETFAAGCQRREREAQYAAHTRLPIAVGEPYPLEELT